MSIFGVRVNSSWGYFLGVWELGCLGNIRGIFLGSLGARIAWLTFLSVVETKLPLKKPIWSIWYHQRKWDEFKLRWLKYFFIFLDLQIIGDEEMTEYKEEYMKDIEFLSAFWKFAEIMHRVMNFTHDL